MTSLHERRAVAGSLAAALLCTLAWGSAVQAEVQATVWPKGVTAPSAGGGPRDVEARVRSLLSQMSLEQKIGQMIQGEIKSVSPADVRTYHLGSVLNGGGSTPKGDLHATTADWLALADRYYDASMSSQAGAPAIPIIWGTDAVHGHNNLFGAVLYPHNIALGATRDPDLVEKIGRAVAGDVRATGVTWAFAPTLAVVDNPRWGRSYESFSQDPAVVRALGEAMVRGLQGAPGAADQLDDRHVIATAKHFIGDGATSDGSIRATRQCLKTSCEIVTRPDTTAP